MKILEIMESKKPTHYFVSVTDSKNSKNKLEEEFCEYLVEFKGALIDADKIEDFKKEIEAKADELSEKHKRCNPLDIYFSTNIFLTGFYLTGIQGLWIQMLKAYYEEI